MNTIKTPEEQIINSRADQLEKIGFIIKCTGNSIWYEKEGVVIVPTLMMCASTKDWNKFIEQNTDINHKL